MIWPSATWRRGAVPQRCCGRPCAGPPSRAQVVPVLCGTALRNKGVQLLLDAVVDYLPSPLDVPPMDGHRPGDRREGRLPAADADEPTAALVFKISTDPYMGRLAYFRVYSGTVRRGETLLNANSGKRERIGRLVRMHADRREEVDEIRAGDIGAVLGLKAHHHRRDAVRPRAPGCPGADRVPGAGHRAGRRAAHQGRPGQAVAGPAAADGRRSHPAECGRTNAWARQCWPAWANSTWTLCWTACAASSAWAPRWAAPGGLL